MVCTVCRHENRKDIERSLVAGQTLRTIAEKWSVSKTALIRHKEHVYATLAKAEEKQEEAHGDRLLKQLVDLQGRTMRLLDKAERGKDGRLVVAAIREARQNMELIGRFLGQIGSNEMNVNLLTVNLDGEAAARLAETYLSRHAGRVLEAHAESSPE